MALIRDLLEAIRHLTKAAMAQTEWLESHQDCATHKNLRHAEERLSVLIKAGYRPKRVQFDWVVGLAQKKTQNNRNQMLELTITNEQKIPVTLSPKTDTGKPAKLDGAPVWSVVAGDSTVVPSADGLTAELVSSDTPGDTTFLVDGDADLGTGVEDIQDTILLHVSGANAKNLGLSAGDPVAK